MYRVQRSYRVLLLTIIMHSSLHGLRLISGNVTAQEAEHTTFTHAIGCSAITPSGIVCVGAGQPGAGHYSIARLSPDHDRFIPLVAPLQFLDQKPSIQRTDESKRAANPLFNAIISHIDLFSIHDTCAVVIDKDPNTVYFFDRPPQDDVQLIHQVTDIRDALTNPGGEIIALETTKKQIPAFIFLGIKPQNGVFGDSGSGIAVVRVRESKCEDIIVDKDNNNKKVEYSHVDAQQACAQPTDTACLRRAASFDCSSDFLKIGHDLSAMGQIIALHYDVLLSRLYIAIRATTGDDAQDGVCALAVSHLSGDGFLHFKPFAPHALFTTDCHDEIIGAKGALQNVSLHHLRTMHTSTKLPYLIVAGGNGDEQSTRRTVYALPIADPRNQNGYGDGLHEVRGTLASRHALPREIFSTHHTLALRVFQSTAATRDDLYTTQDDPANIPARVGGGPLPVGDIAQLYVKHDGVYALVTQSDPGKTPGIFFSQAFFDSVGRIQGWTAWRRIADTYCGVHAMVTQDLTGDYTYIVSDRQGMARNVVRTQWGIGNDQGIRPLIAACATTLPPAQGGIHGLWTTSQTISQRSDIDLLVALGKQSLLLAQTSIGVHEYARPVVGNEYGTPVVCTDGSLAAYQPTRLLAIQGGLLSTIGPLYTATIGYGGPDNAYGYFIVGGARGVGILQNPDGTGWNRQSGMDDQFVGLHTHMRFTPLGNYRDVRKVMCDEHYLYILTSKQLDRIDLCDTRHQSVCLATLTTIAGVEAQDRFFDLLVSNELILLATSSGLYRIGDGACAYTAQDGAACCWIPVELPNNLGAVIHLYGCSVTDDPCDITRTGGMVYVLTGNRSRDYSRVYRISIQPTTSSGITGDTVQPLADKQYEDTPASFIPLCRFRETFATDGVMRLRGRSKDLHSSATVATSLTHVLPLAYESTNSICALERCPSSGVWLVAGDFGLLANE